MSAKRKYNKNSSAKDLYNLSKRLGVMGTWAAVIIVLLFGLGRLFWDKLQAAETSGNHDAIAANRLQKVIIPDSVPNQTVEYMAYLCYFNPKLHIPNCVAYELTADEIDGNVPRVNNFKCDNNVEGCPDPTWYTGSGYDRGHMAPAADFHWSEQAMRESFLMTNVCPQDHYVNSHAWNSLEQKVRNWAARDSSLIIVTGPILSKNMPTLKKGVAVPQHFFKVILAHKASPMRAIAFIMPNKKCDSNLVSYAVTVDEVESRSGLDFFSDLPDDIENDIESQFSYQRWNK